MRKAAGLEFFTSSRLLQFSSALLIWSLGLGYNPKEGRGWGWGYLPSAYSYNYIGDLWWGENKCLFLPPWSLPCAPQRSLAGATGFCTLM